ncbi:putative membrane protein [Janthinobacterium sp. CG_23.3]|uniref:DUF2157 domain-containing protein n=1 Tax=Janthinobacterium sp. CG_23.3 TaxID=3349634 RepID=UPI0038D3C02B
MDVRLALYELMIRHKLDAGAGAALLRLAALEREPEALAPLLRRGVAVLAAALAGLGLILWIAANWETFGRFGRFALIQVVFTAMCAGALWRPAARVPLALLALLAIGGLFAYFGQTYQTGADPWQLFALWAVLALPLCLGARSDVLWTPWALVALTAVSLWVHAHTGHSWRVQADGLPVYALGWGVALALTALLAAPARRLTGAGIWSLRAAALLAIASVTLTALGALFNDGIAPQFWLALVLMALAAAALCQPRLHELFALSALGLGLDVLLVGAMAHALFEGNNNGGSLIGSLLLLGLAAAALLAGTVRFILLQSRRHAGAGEAA